MGMIPAAEQLPELPPIHFVRQSFPRPRVDDPVARVRQLLANVHFEPGEQIAIAAGSRGIAGIAQLTRTVVDVVRAAGANPYIVPAMGSHGGATAEGQREVLASYGITEAAMGAPVRSSMEVVTLEQGECEVPVYLDREAAAADGIIVMNRVKPHTDFHGPYESGLVKMMAIGLGKQAQAMEIHRHGVRGMRDITPQVARQVLAHAPIRCGLAIIENAYDETAEIHLLRPEEILDKEPALLDRARTNMPRLPLEEIDILIVDYMGKNISGVGMDTNILGRFYIDDTPEPATPAVRTILVRDLTESSHGNAIGVGLADVTTRRLAESIDWKATYENTFTNTYLRRAFLPFVGQSDAQALQIALRATRGKPTDQLVIVRIESTLHVDRLFISAAGCDQLRRAAGIEIESTPTPMFADSHAEGVQMAPFPQEDPDE